MTWTTSMTMVIVAPTRFAAAFTARGCRGSPSTSTTHRRACSGSRRPEDRKGTRRPCNRGYFFVVLTDRDHVFFEYTRHHRSEPVCDMFRAFTGFIQADANSV